MPAASSLPPLFDEFPAVSADEWEEQIRQDLGGGDVDAFLRWDSIEGLSLPGLLRREDLSDVGHVPEGSPLGASSAWRIRQDVRASEADAARKRVASALDGGCTDIGLPAEPDGASPVDTPDDLRTILRDGPADGRLHLDGGAGALVLYAALRPLVAAGGLPDWSGSVVYDPVAALATGDLGDPSLAYDLAAELVEATDPSAVRSVSVDLRPYHEAGGSAVQELAFGLGALTETLDRLAERGIPPAAVVDRLQFHLSTSTSYFVEIAKLRALRLLVPQVLGAFAEASGSSLDTGPDDLFIQAQTARRTETLYDPYVNMLRATTEAMAAVLGGCDVLNVRPYDACFRSPDRFGLRIARNVQLLLRHEAHFDVVDDPAAGSYYLETATDRLAEQAWSRFQELENRGGILDGLRAGRMQNDIQAVRSERVQEIEDRNRVLVGTNHYPDLDETRLKEARTVSFCNNGDQDLPEPQIRSLSDLRARLEEGHSVSAVASGLVPDDPAFDPLPQVRIARSLERLRLRTEAYAEREGRTPVVLTAPIGPAGPRSARATFARNLFGVAGFDIESPLQFDTPADAAATAAEVEPDVLVLCSADAEYPRLAPALRKGLDDHGLAPLLVVAGHPERIGGNLPVDEFVHAQRPLRDMLEAVQRRLGIPDELPSDA